MRHLLKTSMVLIMIFIFSGCEKSPDLEVKNIEESFSNPYHENIADTYLAIFQLISTAMKEAITKPQLYFLAEAGDTRDCPDSSITGGATYPKTMTLDFVNCVSAGILYNGSVPITFNAALGSDAASGPEITVPAVSGLMVNGYTFDLTGPITLERNSSGAASPYSYDFTLGGDIISSKNGTTTTLPSGSCGTFGTGFQDGDDPDNPLTFVDNPFDVSLKQADVICQGAGAPQTLCTMTGDEPLSLNPSNCSCPTDGDLSITMGACGTTGGAASAFDFGSDANNDDSGACDVFVDEVTLIDFLSWEGDFTAVGGAIDGAMSTDIGVRETNSTTVGTSLQLTDTGTGTAGHGFMWTTSSTSSSGMLNVGQTIGNTTTPSTWINEIHYDNDGGDVNEGIEIAGPAGLDLSNYCVQPYNGNGGAPDGRETNLATFLMGEGLPTTIPDEGNGFGAVFIDIAGLQNGAPDGVAFYRKDNVAASFCSSR